MGDKNIKDISLYEKLFTFKDCNILNSKKLPVVVKEGNHQVVVETHEKNNESKFKYYDVNTSVIKDSKSIYNVVVTYNDTTELQVLKRELAKKENLLAMSEMAASIAAHEIKNPIFSIRGFLQLLEKSLEKEDERREYTDVILSELDRLNRLIDKFLSLKKGNLKKSSPVNINYIVQDVIKLFEPMFKKKHIKCHFKKNDEEIIILGNHDKLKQVFINILQNCYEAIDSGKNLYIKTKSEKGQAVIIIKDEGKGIKKQDLSQIFKPFYTTKKRGTGLGLFITNKIIRKHNGDIKVDSEEGKGTTFTLTLKKTEI